MLYTRTWELLLGTILSLGMFPRLQSAWLRNAATLAGIGMIGYAARVYSASTVFPGLSALVPCVGSALIIGAGESGSSLVGALLSLRPVVFVGLISYSLYLWHWPVIVLQKMGLLIGMSTISSYRCASFLSWARFDVLVELCLSFVLATLSWRFVERPFRSGPVRLSGRPLFVSAGVVMATLLLVSTVTIVDGGFKSRFPDAAVQLASGGHDSVKNRVRQGTCFITTEDRVENYDYKLCLHQESGKLNYLLLGDSHSAMLWPALSASLHDANVMQFSIAACTPVLNPSGSPDCRKMMAYIFRTYLPSHPVSTFLVGRWFDKNLDELTKTIAWTKQHNIPVTVIGPTPEYDGTLPRLLAYSIAWNNPSLANRHRVASSEVLDAKMEGLAANVWHVPYISLYKEICSAETCVEYADAAHKIPLMDDGDHLNWFGASLVVQQLVNKGELR